jgi:hypothetical protein
VSDPPASVSRKLLPPRARRPRRPRYGSDGWASPHPRRPTERIEKSPETFKHPPESLGADRRTPTCRKGHGFKISLEIRRDRITNPTGWQDRVHTHAAALSYSCRRPPRRSRRRTSPSHSELSFGGSGGWSASPRCGADKPCANPFARGARTGVRITSIPSLRKGRAVGAREGCQNLGSAPNPSFDTLRGQPTPSLRLLHGAQTESATRRL